MEDLPKFYNEKFAVQMNMQRYGGGFVSALGRALAGADINNAIRIRKAFPEYWEKYLNFKPE